MHVRRIFTDEDAVSSVIGVVLMVAVAVILAAAVGAFALGLAEDSTNKIPSASVEVTFGVDGGADTVDVTLLGGDTLEKKHMAVALEGTVIWDDTGTSSDFATYDGKTWAGDQVESGETLGLKEQSATAMQAGDQIKVIWNNGEKSQILGTGTA